MPRSLPFLLLFLLLLEACGSKENASLNASQDQDVIWEGELQVTGPDARFMACASGIRYPITGPGLDTVLKLYTNQRSVRGQTMKAWITGHLSEQHPGQRDTAFVASTINHIDATLSCPPRPNARLAGRYTVSYDDPTGERTIDTDLFPTGEVLSYTHLPGRSTPLEQDGRWGVNSVGEVEVYWPHIDKRLRYGVTENALTLRDPSAPKGRPVYVMLRSGPARRMDGTFGAVVRWMVAVSNAHGGPIDSLAVHMDVPLDSLLPSEPLRNSLRDSAVTWIPLSAEQQRVEWPAMSTVHDLVGLKRMSDRRAQ
jgi:hypothetical protein